ncbi:MAG: hypothetical protein OEZ02_02290 [Anaerolineae bacterium]|nr:hypothetical protein [Anaerolineae bacterium]
MIEETPTKKTNGKTRQRFGGLLVLLGFVIFMLGTEPSLFNMDRSTVIGFLQIAVFLFGLALICLGGYISLNALWHGRQRTIAADIGIRLVSTGYVIALVSGFADVFGLGTRPLPYVPFFGYWQARGVLIGEIMIVIGFLMMIPYRRAKES